MSDHPMNEADEATLQRVLIGELEPGAPEVLELLEREPAARERLEELLTTRASVEELGAAARTFLEEARREVTAADRRRVRRTLEDAARRRNGRGLRPGGPARRTPLLVALAAVVILALGLAWLSTRPDSEPRDAVLLGSGGLEALAPPIEGADRFEAFRWGYDLPEQGWYVLTVHALDEDGERGELLRSFRTEESSWTPTPADLEGWPSAVEWMVEAYDASGQRVAWVRASARYSPP